MLNITFCENCRDDVEYTEKQVPMTGTIKGKEYHYIGIEARCAKCGSVVFDPDISDRNLEALYNVFRKENDIVSLDVIRAIPKKYNIGKRPLSLLLGWGELTYTRFWDGDIPTRQYSETLMRVFNDPVYYSDLIEANREYLKSQSAYEKTRAAVDALLSQNESSDSKINIVIRYLLYCCEDITPLALQKALYYIQGFYYAFYKSFIFVEDCQAWIHGPVYRDIYFRYRDYHFDPIEKTEGFDTSVFSATEKAICDSVINYFCCYSGKVLERFTHSELPWLAARGDLPDSVPSDRTIDKSIIGDYFETVRKKYNMVNPGDIKEYARDMFSRM